MDEHEILEGILRDIQRMRAEMRISQKETDVLEIDLKAMHEAKAITELGYVIYLERLRRSREDISFVLRKLDSERKDTLRKLFELDEE